jgi:hypothetical protein
MIICFFAYLWFTHLERLNPSKAQNSPAFMFFNLIRTLKKQELWFFCTNWMQLVAFRARKVGVHIQIKDPNLASIFIG